MASDNLDIPQISIVDVQDEDNSSSALALPSPSLDSPCFERRPWQQQPWWQRSKSPSTMDNHTSLNGHLSPLIPVLRSARNSPDVSGSPSYASDNSSRPPNPSSTHSAHSGFTRGEMSRDNTPRPKRSSAGPAHSDVTNALPSRTDVDTSSDAGSRPSTVTSFFRRTVHFMWSSSPPSGESRETDTGSVTTRIVLDNLEGRLEAAKKLHGEFVDLQMLYESGTVATIKDLRMTGKEAPCYLQRQSTELRVFQDSRGHFHKTMPYSTRWTCCWLIFGNCTRN